MEILTVYWTVRGITDFQVYECCCKLNEDRKQPLGPPEIWCNVCRRHVDDQFYHVLNKYSQPLTLLSQVVFIVTD